MGSNPTAIERVDSGLQPQTEGSKTFPRDALSELLRPYIVGRFLLPDEVTISGDRNSATGRMTVPDDRDYIRDHFNGVVPGVIQIEFSQQVGAILLASRYPELGGMALEVREAIFRALLVAGNSALAEVHLSDMTEKRGVPSSATFDATVHREGSDDLTSVSFKLKLLNRGTLDRIIRGARSK